MPDSLDQAPAGAISRLLALDEVGLWPGDDLRADLFYSSEDLGGGARLCRVDHLTVGSQACTKVAGRTLVYVPPVEELDLDQARTLATGLATAVRLLGRAATSASAGPR